MDIVITFVIILIIGLSVLPFFLLGGAFKRKPAAADAGDGPVTPVPTGEGSTFFPRKDDDSASGHENDADGGDADAG
jgi:hypothetical protein